MPRIIAACLLSGALAVAVRAQEPPVGVADQQALLKSSDPKLAASGAKDGLRRQLPHATRARYGLVAGVAVCPWRPSP